MILDQMKQVEKLDRSNMYQLLIDFPQQWEKARKIGEQISPVKIEKLKNFKRNFKNIVVAGMGGSAIGGDFLKELLASELKIPFFVTRNYSLPAFVDRASLVITCSYSGNTEETLSAYHQAQSKKAKTVAITSNGQLKKYAERDKNLLITIPGGMPPRTALGYLFLPALILLQKIELIKNKNSQIKECGVFLQKLAGDFSLDSPSSSNPAKQYALKLYRKIPLLYAETGIMEIVAKRWKTQLNENSKVPAFVNVFPELNHNEIVGWETNPPWLKKIIVLYFSDVKTHPRNTRRVRITRELMKDRIDAFLEIGRKENSLLTRVFASVYLGDFVSFYLALLNKQDPTEIKAIDYLKSKLAQYK